MVKFTKQHYRMIGSMIRKIKGKEKIRTQNRMIKIFKGDNPRFDKKRFIQYIRTGSDKKRR